MPKTIAFKHDTVLLHETVDMLEVKPNGIYVDATLGGAGHSEYLLSKLTTNIMRIQSNMTYM